MRYRITAHTPNETVGTQFIDFWMSKGYSAYAIPNSTPLGMWTVYRSTKKINTH